MDLTGASRGTVRHAMALLRERGLIYTRAQLGSFIAESKPESLRRLQPEHFRPDLLRGADKHVHARCGLPCLNDAIEKRMRGYLAPEFPRQLSSRRPPRVHARLRSVVP
jgi:DNA-binding transcriptional MocR family regulator